MSETQNQNEVSPPSTMRPPRRLRRRHFLLGLAGLAVTGGGGYYAWNYLARAAKQAHTTLNVSLEDGVQSLHWLPDNRRLIVASSDGQIQGWDTTTRTVFLSIPHEPYHGFTEPQTSHTLDMEIGGQVKLSPRGDTLAIVLQYRNISEGLYLHRLMVRDTMTGRNLLLDQTFPSIHDIAWSPDGTRLAVLVEQDTRANPPTTTVQIWDISLRRLRASHVWTPSLPAWITWSADGTSLLALTATGNRMTWNATLSQQQEVKHFVDPLVVNVFQPQWTPGGRKAVVSVSVHEQSSKGSIVEICISDMQEPGKLRILRVHVPEPPSLLTPQVCWSPDGKQLVFTGFSSIYLIDAEGHLLFTYTGQEALSQNISYKFMTPAWSPDGKYIASGVYQLDGDGYYQGSPPAVQIWQPSSS